eukprot:11166501-Lingulodinium_polyedra.AAC.1
MSTRPRHCAAFSTRCAMMRLDRRFVTAATRKSHVCAHRARTGFSVRAWSARACGLRAVATAK